ncbi:DeoR/GlpR family DNA-binding transcription regulator [Prosthecomicrobium pneumaticum]|uniref:DeoR/GlpR family transcriptional regulator of sugar metabolism n=1 Tax=Prosthecomicrobium pneumaticum TaxID=81895 RepID=A0A7W9CTM3_9HYPH|nr:DeoR/GlpR family DNA-binding transcription regulator [Prosthecomicrobium pneumaticum]MBB5751434.1 DeoR/GlpR family transcriptional regulator of sugar metabolism [Prosthecomicrobium pneumaticum]
MDSNIPDDGESLSKSERRRTRILQMLMSGATAQIRDLAEALGVSLMTVHRDLAALEKEGLVRRLRGAVSAEKSLLFESSYNYRGRKQVEEKRRLARAAVARLEPGNAVVCDDSTTTYYICDFIEEMTPLTVITNAVPILERLKTVPEIDLIAAGGRYHAGYNGYFGAVCERTLRSFHVDVAIMSTTTIQGLSLFTPDEIVVRAKQAMMEIARRKILLADATKFQFTALNYVAQITDFDLVLLTGDVPAANLEQLRKAGVAFELV